jgi:uncharacterized protein YegJ (DUF2314 family)
MLRALFLAGVMAGPVLAEDTVLPYAATDPQMAAAIAEARATLPLFLAHALDAEGNSIMGSVIKVELPTVAGSPVDPEHIWVTPFARLPDGSFAGLLANEPAYLGALRAGDRVDFTEGMISDWHFDAPSGRYWGSYTSRVMHASGAFGDTPFDQLFEPNPVPPDWR